VAQQRRTLYWLQTRCTIHLLESLNCSGELKSLNWMDMLRFGN